jgi:hypothetical protein
VSICIGYSTIETKEAARIGYNRFRFPHSYSGEGLGVDITGFFFRMSTQVKAEVRSTKPSPEYECGKRNPLLVNVLSILGYIFRYFKVFQVKRIVYI